MKERLFYGWWVLFGLFLMYAGSSIGVSTFPLLNAELREIHGWTHEQVSLGPTFLYMAISIVAIFSGALIDRYQPKIVIIIGSICSIFSILLYYIVDTIPLLISVYLIFSIAITNTGVLSGMAVITRWFKKYRGIAAGIFTTGSSLGGIIFPKMVSILVAKYGLDTAILGLAAAGSLFIIVPLFIIKNNPQEVGTSIDGNKEIDSSTESAKHIAPTGVSLKEASQTIEFYMLLFITGSMWLVINTLVQHLSLLFKDLNISIQEAGTIQMLFFTCSLTGKFTFGWLSDKFSKKSIMLLAGVNMSLGCLLMLMAISQPNLLYGAVLVYGIGFSGTFTMVQLLVAEYYTGKHYGKILGVVITIDNLAGALGIYLLGNLRTSSGSYTSGFTLMLILCILATICTILLKKPKIQVAQPAV
ncbi:MAG: MFS transporter [Thermoflexibacter sp.]|jgi:MFS family permease|nr:MFS transporter [Thermoflexibacter sp.]